VAIVVRRATPRDADDVLRLLAELGRPAVADNPGAQRDVYLDHLVADDAAVFVADDLGRIAGFASLWIRPRLNWTTPEAWVPDLFVAEDYRRRGLARALLDACVREARRSGCHRLVLESGHQREAAHQVYERYGFVHHGRAYALRI
jgi:[ribosomal protein S18]-alanine N-acetyltransferase